MRYLLDTNVCIDLLRGNRIIAQKIDSVGFENCYISEITKAELLLGAQLSRLQRPNEGLSDFLDAIDIVPISRAVERFAVEKARLLRAGEPIEDFDILIGCTAIEHGMTMISGNTAHLNRLRGIVLENWK